MTFPNVETFERGMTREEARITWGKLEVNTIYRVEAFNMQVGKYGGGMVLTLSKDGGETVHAWATPLVEKRLKFKVGEVMRSTFYIRPTGLRASTSNPARKYHTFDVMEEKMWWKWTLTLLANIVVPAGDAYDMFLYIDL